MTLSQFYIDLKKMWKSGGPNGTEGGWAHYYYGIVSKVINDNNFKNCAEVGIGYGLHAEQILQNTSVERLYLIDPMTFYPNDGFATDVINFGGFELLVQNIIICLGSFSDRYVWFRQPSTSISNEQIPAESLDLVFIDADHSYNAVKADLPFWFSKVRKGGWLLGDDYASCCPGTTKAVDEFAAINGFELRFLHKPNNEYPIYYFIKE